MSRVKVLGLGSRGHITGEDFKDLTAMRVWQIFRILPNFDLSRFPLNAMVYFSKTCQNFQGILFNIRDVFSEIPKWVSWRSWKVKKKKNHGRQVVKHLKFDHHTVAVQVRLTTDYMYTY